MPEFGELVARVLAGLLVDRNLTACVVPYNGENGEARLSLRVSIGLSAKKTLARVLVSR